MQFPEEGETLPHTQLNFCISGWNLYQEMRGLSLHGESSALGNGDSFHKAEGVFNKLFSWAQEQKASCKESYVWQLSAALFLDVQKPRPVGKKKDQSFSLTRDNVPLPPSYKSSNFPMAMTPPEPVTPSEMLSLGQNFWLKHLPGCFRIAKGWDTTREPLFCQRLASAVKLFWLS